MNRRNALENIRERMAVAARRAGRMPEAIKLVAVSKYFPAGAIRDVYDAGQRVFGESRAQELRDKMPQLPADIDWHFIGPLQTNKLRYLIPACRLIHAVESVEMAEAIQKYSKKKQHITRILVEVNSSGEKSKHGLAPDDVVENVLKIGEYSHIRVEGLMTIGPHTDDIKQITGAFATTRRLLEKCNQYLADKPMRILSMGMSGDFEIAIYEGSTMVRVGSAIFGTRRR